MTKCDFCLKRLPDGKCWWTIHVARENDCKAAISLMVETIKNSNCKIEIIDRD